VHPFLFAATKQPQRRQRQKQELSVPRRKRLGACLEPWLCQRIGHPKRCAWLGRECGRKGTRSALTCVINVAA